MPKIFTAFALLLLMGSPALAEQDPSCANNGTIVGYITEGFDTITIACGQEATCSCHTMPTAMGLCTSYPCDSKGQPIETKAPAADPAQQPAPDNSSCRASGDTVGMVTKGDITVVMACSTAKDAGAYPCVCHESTAVAGKCRIYPCDAKGQEPVTGKHLK